MSGINDFTVKIANVNGSGSASANGLLAKAIFRMGVPISAKNIFPSNIQGLPTWYVIRVNGDGYLGRSEGLDFMIAMNPQSMIDDMESISDGGYLLYDSSRPLPGELPPQVTPLAVPLTELSVSAFPEVKTRMIMKNVTYVGAAAAFLDIDMDIIEKLLGEIYASKPHLVDLNFKAVRLSYDYVKKNFETPLLIHTEPSSGTDGCVLLNGNTATALGCLYAGATFAAWYPLTPSTSVTESFAKLCEKYRRDPETGGNRYCIVQAEDELAAVGMAIGAGWNGGRAFTPTSGPGLSLMSEFLGLAYFAEIPVVVFDVQRAGPSTGLPTRTQQGDILSAAYASHGDTRHILLFPADPGECFSMAVAAFDLSERYQTPVIVLSDLDIGMNDWMVEIPEWDETYQPDRGKVITREELEEMDGPFYRYIDSDGDGICTRSLPGTHPKGAYFTRGTGHDPYGRYTEKGSDYKENVERIARKFEGAKSAVPPAEFIPSRIEGETLGIITVGGNDAAVREATHLLADEGIAVDYLRIKAFPFGSDVESFLENHEWVAVVEQNRDAQLRSLLLLETKTAKSKLEPILYFEGEPVTASFIVEQMKEKKPVWTGSLSPGEFK